jgi:hypothetical protein
VIPRTAEIAYALYGAWRLARLDARGMDYFDRSVEGFWKSFFAAILVAPGYLLTVVWELGAVETTADSLSVFLTQSLIYGIIWLAFPLVMFYVTKQIGRGERYIGFIVALNWAAVIQMLVTLPVVVLAMLEALPNAALLIASLVVFFAILFYQGFITRVSLGLGNAAAGAIVISAVLLQRLIEEIGLSMIM